LGAHLQIVLQRCRSGAPGTVRPVRPCNLSKLGGSLDSCPFAGRLRKFGEVDIDVARDGLRLDAACTAVEVALPQGLGSARQTVRELEQGERDPRTAEEEAEPEV